MLGRAEIMPVRTMRSWPTAGYGPGSIPQTSLSPYMFKMSTFCHSTLLTTTSNVDESRNASLPFLSSENSMNIGFLDTNLTRTLPQWLLRGSCKNLHDYITTLVISGTSLSSAPTFQHILPRSIDFKLVSDSCHCYPSWWWCIKFNPPTSSNFKNILLFPITLQ